MHTCTQLYVILMYVQIFISCYGSVSFLSAEAQTDFLTKAIRNIMIMIKIIKVDMKKYFNVPITSGVITTPSYCLHV